MNTLEQTDDLVLLDSPDLVLAGQLLKITSHLKSLRRKGTTLRTSAPWLRLIDTAIAYAMEAQERLVTTSRRVAELERLSMTDELTGLLNRRGFEDRLQRELAGARRNGESGVLIFIDLDEFKPINDIYGHAAGDEVLRQAAGLLCANVRESDCVGRLGGDEFVVLMPKSQQHNGLLRAKALEEVLNHAVAEWRGIAIPFRASCGVHTYASGADWRDMLNHADAEMYRKKGSQKPRNVANDTGRENSGRVLEMRGGIGM